MRTRYIVIGIAVIALAAGAGLAISAALKSSRDAGAAAAAATPRPTPTTKVWMAAFRWSGGGPSNDIRNSKPFDLLGGRQRVTVTTKPLRGEYRSPSVSWTIYPADGRDGYEMLNPPINGGTSEFYLPQGSYYMDANTLDCEWTLTMRELRQR